MADNFAVLTSNGTTTATFRATDVGGGILGMMSIPMNTLGTAMVGQAVMATSVPVAIASNQSAVPFNMVSFNGTAVTIGQQVLTASIPVALPSNQIVSTNITQVGGGGFSLGQLAIASSISVTLATGTVLTTTFSPTVPTLLTVASTSGAPAATDIKTSAGTLKSVNLYNNNTAAPVFLKIYNSSAAGVTVGTSTTTLKFTAGVVPGAARDINLGDGAAFTTAMSYAITLGIANTDTAAVSVNDLIGIVTFL